MSAATTAIESPNASTGPRTPEGKAISSRNAIRHGLASETMIMHGESEAEWNEFRDAMFAEWLPTTPTEEVLVGDMAKHHWLKDRAIRLQNEYLQLLNTQALTNPTFTVLMRYQAANERSFARAVKQLENLRKTQVREFVSQNAETQAEPDARRPTLTRKISRMSQPAAFRNTQTDHKSKKIEIPLGLRTAAAKLAS